ncbi:roadblock/LC7 domain-containing protein [Micromonospora sp. C51]|uniref:roadblock/LC7 domain-containing protein n=1 Tax=Micromonospora sp. C51 TaxID=2824879 RepID=UPI001B39A2A0|nr:roadblock/LC7 domain-containing protein [Micromonospora sp. C51]MBQ1049279.1 roadblock/LC7 domain-containing protein [Micromonospora sp. C51]
MSTSNLSFLLNHNVRVVHGVSHAVAVSVDGLLLAFTDGLNVDAAERLAAVAAGLNSLLKGAADELNAGGVRGNITDTDRGYLILTSLSRGASLLVLARRDADLAFVTAELERFAEQVGDSHLNPSFAAAAAGAR